MNINNSLLKLVNMQDVLTLLDFHVVLNGNQCILYHVPTGTVWKVDYTDFEQARVVTTINDLISCVSKYPSISERIYSEAFKWKPSSKIALVVTTSCNMSCDYCYASQGNYGLLEENMSKQMALKAIEKLENAFGTTDWVQFFGGEPVLNFDVIKSVVEVLRERHSTLRFSINTNGSLITEEIARFLGNSMSDIYVSLDGPPEIHDLHRKFRGDFGSWGAVMKGVRKLRSHLKKDSKLVVEATYTKEHIEKGYSISDLWNYLVNECGFDDAQVVWASYSAAEDFDDVQWSKIGESVSQFAKTCNDKPVETSTLAERLMKFSKDYHCHTQPCTAGLSSLTVTPSGDVYPCFQLIKKDLWMGNVLEDPFPDRHFRSVWQRLLLNSKLACKECSLCWLRYICTSCLGKRYTLNGDIGRTMPKECEVHKKVSEQILKLIANKL